MPRRLQRVNGRDSWNEIRDRIDLAAVATALMGPAPGRHGERGRRLWWRCPFHEDRNPSFCVSPGKPWWQCYGCGEHGDAPKLAMRLRGIGFPEAARVVAELAGVVASSRGSRPNLSLSEFPCPIGDSETPTTPTTDNPRPPLPGRLGQTASNPAKASQPGPERSSGMPLADCLVLLEEAQERLWRPEGASALASLQERGLTDETIRVSRLGFVDSVSIPTRKGDHCFRARGVVIPWFDGDRLALVKIRQPEGSKPKYAEAYRDRPTIFPSLAAVRPGRPLIVTEGEFDCLLLAQELGELAAVVTLGSASNRPDPAILGVMLAAPVWYIATDADEAGDKAASGWPAQPGASCRLTRARIGPRPPKRASTCVACGCPDSAGKRSGTS